MSRNRPIFSRDLPRHCGRSRWEFGIRTTEESARVRQECPCDWKSRLPHDGGPGFSLWLKTLNDRQDEKVARALLPGKIARATAAYSERGKLIRSCFAAADNPLKFPTAPFASGFWLACIWMACVRSDV